ncbi:DUF411 domain-containing protein [Microvirga sesbaniae]|uniref:DUF411 domain-containing protein n=1 Tax=Microvirga sesbaniae TaxID=681392 RepID=UPI0021C78466|nr:DUF411 domain-containing protein [Microvirga sp. HBU67692]
MLDRRRFLTVLGASGAALVTGQAFAQATLPKVVVTKDPNCGCCGGWVEHMKAAGFPVEVVTTPQVNRVKVRLSVPDNLASCHTAEVGGYVIEGHVPADAVKRLLVEKPQAKGLAVPGMPVGSPGMEVAGVENDTYEVVLFGPSGQATFARYQGTRPV